MMNGVSPAIVSSPTASAAGRYDGGRSTMKSGTSSPVHRPATGSHHTYALRSDHGRPSGSADARLYKSRRSAGHAQPRAVWFTPPANDARVDPAAARRRPVVAQRREPVDRRAVGDREAVDLLQHLEHIGLVVRTDRRVRPREVEQRAILRVRRPRVQRAQPQAEVVHEPQLAAPIARRLDRLVVELQQPLRVRVRAVLLGVRGRGEEEDLGRTRQATSARTPPSRSTRSRAPPASPAAPTRPAADRPFIEPTTGFSPITK